MSESLSLTEHEFKDLEDSLKASMTRVTSASAP